MNLFNTLPAYILALSMVLHPAIGSAGPNLEVRRDLALEIEEIGEQSASKACDWFNYLTSRNGIVIKYAPISDDEWVLIWKEDFSVGVFLYFQETCKNDAIRFLSGILTEIDGKIGHEQNAEIFTRLRHSARTIAHFLRKVIDVP
jgi:hypothetical protein